MLSFAINIFFRLCFLTSRVRRFKKMQLFSIIKILHEFKESGRTLTAALLTRFGHELHELAQI